MSNLYNSYANFKTEINLLSFRDSNIFASDPNVLRISFSTSFPLGVVALSAVVVTACLNCSQTVFVANTYYTVCITSDIICCARSCWWPLLGHIVFSSTCNNISFQRQLIKRCCKRSFFCCPLNILSREVWLVSHQLWNETSIYDLPGSELLEVSSFRFADVNLCYNEMMISGIIAMMAK